MDCIKVIFKKFKKELTHTNQILGSHKERMKSIKEHKIFNEELDGIGKEAEQKAKVHEDLGAFANNQELQLLQNIKPVADI